ncbi:MAG: orotidine-5'-phosphate decarboxylase [Propionibacteriaceae bacterium]|nr:orotidine-5'-phosphate decarboxylase [Propionibacteriaceae bacterium]
MYSARLQKLTDSRGRLCVGLDPQPSVLHAWGLADDLAGLERCVRETVAALADVVAVFKPQSGFFEPFGSRGIAVLERVLADISGAGALSLLDVKRGDIGSTMGGYARAYLSDGAPLAADAITVSPYLGFESLRPAIDAAIGSGRGLYVLARTSNPEGHAVQLARGEDGRPVAQAVIDAASEENRASGTAAIGLVVGGTHRDLGVSLDGFSGSILVPGIGAQGGRISDLGSNFGAAVEHVLPSVSREVLNHGPDPAALRGQVQRLLAEWVELS